MIELILIGAAVVVLVYLGVLTFQVCHTMIPAKDYDKRILEWAQGNDVLEQLEAIMDTSKSRNGKWLDISDVLRSDGWRYPAFGCDDLINHFEKYGMITPKDYRELKKRSNRTW